MQVALAALADAANTSADGKLNLLGAFQSIWAPGTPCTHPQMFVVAIVRADIGEKGTEHTLHTWIGDPDGHMLLETPPIRFQVPVDALATNPERVFILGLNMVSLPAFGQYTVDIRIDGETARQLDLLVQPLAQNPSGQQGTDAL